MFAPRNIIRLAASQCVVAMLCCGTVTAQSPDPTLLRTLAASRNIIAQQDVLSDFAEGKEETKVIVLVKPMSAATSKIGTPLDLRSEIGKQSARADAATAIKATTDQLNSSRVKQIRKFSYVNGFAATVTPEGLQELAENPNVISVEKDRLLFPTTAQGIPLINAAAVRNTYKGAGVSVAIIDTGVDYLHPDLGGTALGNNTKVIGGYDLGGSVTAGVPDADPMPDLAVASNGHGTACAGLAAGLPPSAGGGDYIGGVAPDAKVYALKVQDKNGTIYFSYMLAAVEWSVTNQNLDPNNPLLIISMSLGGGVYTTACDATYPSLAAAIDKAVAASITTFASSANDANKGAIASPACLSKVISVGAVYDANIGGIGFSVCSDSTTAADQVACYSNSASFLALLGPAFNAATLEATGNGSAQYDPQFGGTSAAAPYVAGAAAVIQSAAKDKLGRYLTPGEVKQYLTGYGDPVTDSANGITTPRVNLGQAVEALVPGIDPGTVLSPMYKLLL